MKISNYYLSEKIDLGIIKNASELKILMVGELLLCPPFTNSLT